MTEPNENLNHSEQQSERGLLEWLTQTKAGRVLMVGVLAGVVWYGSRPDSEEDSEEKDKQTEKSSVKPKGPNTTAGPNGLKTPFSPYDDPNVPQSNLPEGHSRVEFPPIPGIYSKLEAVETCDLNTDEFNRAEPLDRFAMVIENCRGKLQGDGSTLLKSTIDGHHLNSNLFIALERNLDLEGSAKDLPQIMQRTFVVHREDGKDGLLGGNLITSEPIAFTNALTDKGTDVSHSLSSIPLDGNNRRDVAALATELCQSKMLAADHLKAEKTCNSFGLATECVYSNLSYEEYVTTVGQIAYVDAARSLQFKAEPISRETYKQLAKDLANKPDILVKD